MYTPPKKLLDDIQRIKDDAVNLVEILNSLLSGAADQEEFDTLFNSAKDKASETSELMDVYLEDYDEEDAKEQGIDAL